MVSSPSDRVANYHFYGIAVRQAAHPDVTSRLIEQAVLGELKSLDSGGREVWHPKEFSEALHVIEQGGPEYQECVSQIRKSIEPYRERGRIYDVYDM
jgi:hypothetical protein